MNYYLEDKKCKEIAEKYFDIARQDLFDLGYNIFDYECRVCAKGGVKTYLGECIKYNNNSYVVVIMKTIILDCPINIVKDVIMHELIHVLTYGENKENCHAGRWQEIANVVNEKLGYNVQSLTEIPKEYDLKYFSYLIKCKQCRDVRWISGETQPVKKLKLGEHIPKCKCCGSREFELMTVKEYWEKVEKQIAEQKCKILKTNLQV